MFLNHMVRDMKHTVEAKIILYSCCYVFALGSVFIFYNQ
ncbi:putative membrane protein [Escherichia coli 5-366-08_S1_C1]|nr:putative membrane protein [Escherichia coli 5-366-08_S1_C3]KEL68430.1 putative membrane protein [Escherichia coli 5-366-08_S1_C1]